MTPPKFDCLCAGIVVADFVCAPVSHVPQAGGLVMTDAISPAIGGCASNVAVDLARLGRKALVVGRVGADMPGRFVRDELAAAGVDTQNLVETPEIRTSSTLVINVRNEDRRFIHAFGANGRFNGSEITPALVRDAKVVYVGGFCLMPKLAADRVAEVFGLARDAGIPTVLDVVIPDPQTCREQLEKVLPWTDVFLPNVDEGRWHRRVNFARPVRKRSSSPARARAPCCLDRTAPFGPGAFRSSLSTERARGMPSRLDLSAG
jgi:sugar/nucleoside kinase (ribokinase family)